MLFMANIGKSGAYYQSCQGGDGIPGQQSSTHLLATVDICKLLYYGYSIYSVTTD